MADTSKKRPEKIGDMTFPPPPKSLNWGAIQGAVVGGVDGKTPVSVHVDFKNKKTKVFRRGARTKVHRWKQSARNPKL